jgi:hypothetical protein
MEKPSVKTLLWCVSKLASHIRSGVHEEPCGVSRASYAVSTTCNMRFSDDHLKALDQWRRKQEDMPTRSEAIRRLVELGLKAKPRT